MGRVRMVLIDCILRVTRAFCIPLFTAFFFGLWLSRRDPVHSDQFLWSVPHSIQLSLFHVADFRQTGYFLLTDVYLLNHWFTALFPDLRQFYSDLLHGFQAQSLLTTSLALQAVYVWGTIWARVPPDPGSALFPEGVWDNTSPCTSEDTPTCFDMIVKIPDPADSDVPAADEISVGTSPHAEVEDQATFTWECSRQHFIRPRTVRCNALIQNNTRINNIGSKFDVTSESFVLDSGASDHLCCQKSLFVGEIRPLRGVNLQGVGGMVKASGYGTIQFSVADDDGVKHTFRVHNVLYVPEAPMNLLSPQKWIAGLSDVERLNRGALMITLDEVSLLLWGRRRFLKTIHHPPSIGLPILSVNEGMTLKESIAGNMKTVRKPCLPAFMHTSKEVMMPNIIEDDDETVQIGNPRIPPTDESQSPMIVPIDEDDPIFESFPDTDTLAPEEEISDNTSDATDSDFDASTQNHLADSTSSTANQKLSDEEESELLKQLQAPLSTDEEEFLTIHRKLKHLPERFLHRLAEAGFIPRKFAKMRLPPCPSCIFGRQTKRPWRSKGGQSHIRRQNHTRPGDGTSVDQLESRHPGLVPQTKGFHRTTERYVGATVFVDHATGYTYVHHIKDFTGPSNLEAKQAYETKCAEIGVTVRSYHGDNGRFSEALWITDAAQKNQQMSFCGVGSHFQNGIAEKRIRDLTEYARTLLVHGNQIWPEAVKLALWPYALKEAERISNELRVGEDGLTPFQRFSRTKVLPNFKDEHPLFCPTYALDASLQGGSKLPRWAPRSRAGVYLGRSKHHASNVALILNLETGNVSPQYHLTFDDNFSTVEYLRKREVPPFWEEMVRTQSEFRDSSCGPDASDPDGSRAQKLLRELRDVFLDSMELAPSEGALPTSEGALSTSEGASSASEGAPSATVPASEGETAIGHNESATSAGSVDEIEYYDADSSGYRRSQRTRNHPSRLGFSTMRLAKGLSALSVILTSQLQCVHSYVAHRQLNAANIPGIHATSQQKTIFAEQMVNLNCDSTFNTWNPIMSVKADNEVYMFHEILKMPDKPEFIKAMVKELEDHHQRKHWVMLKRKSVGNVKTIKTVWSFKRKRRPDGSIIKYKARLCAHGGMQVHGDTYWDTYAPVVSWMSVRLMLIFSEIHHLHTRSIDFTLAFPQADVKVDIYMDLPLGCSSSDGVDNKQYVLKLIKNLYGLKDAGKTWFEHLKTGLESLGYTSSAIDPCIFYKKNCVILVYVDDCLVFADKRETADKLIEDLLKAYSLTDEGELGIEGETVSSYLGVKVHYDKENGQITLTQPFLIERIIELLGNAVQDANVKRTPAEYKRPLHKDLDGPDRKQDWNYRSAIGMLNYLAASTRPDILYAVHSAARFSANPKLIHEQAVKRICRYLKGTQDKGLILKPDVDRGVDCYVDASFATEFDKSRSNDPSTVLSRTGYVILYKGCPIIWVSKMQTEISLSTTEAEYIALSQSMRDLIPFTNLLAELQSFYADEVDKPRVLCKLFEDNNGALILAREQKYRPRTKHIALKYHHFRSFVSEGKVDILPIDTREQIADQFTKALDEQTFVRLRYKLLGW